jgi:hypothetical protein
VLRGVGEQQGEGRGLGHGQMADHAMLVIVRAAIGLGAGVDVAARHRV